MPAYSFGTGEVWHYWRSLVNQMLYTELPSLPPWHSLFVNIRGLSKVKPQQLCITFSKTLAFGHPFLQALEMIRALFFLITTVYNDTQDLKKKKKNYGFFGWSRKKFPVSAVYVSMELILHHKRTAPGGWWASHALSEMQAVMYAMHQIESYFKSLAWTDLNNRLWPALHLPCLEEDLCPFLLFDSSGL